MSRVFIVIINDDLVGVFSSFRNADIFCHENYFKYEIFKRYTIWIKKYDPDRNICTQKVNWSKMKKESI